MALCDFVSNEFFTSMSPGAGMSFLWCKWSSIIPFGLLVLKAPPDVLEMLENPPATLTYELNHHNVLNSPSGWPSPGPGVCFAL
jgi:hypothetical protein